MTWTAVDRIVDSDGDRKELQGLFHLTCSGACSWHEFASEIVRIERKKNQNLKVKEIVGIPTTEYKTPATRPLNSRLDCSRFEASFGKSRVDWKSALESVLQRL